MSQFLGVLNASNFVLYTGTSVASSTVMGFATDVSIDISESPRDITTKFSQAWRSLASGLRQFTISGTHLFAENAINGEAQLWSYLQSRTEISFKLTVQNGDINSTAEVNGNTRYTGRGRITSITRSGGVEDNVTFSFTIEGSGALVRETISE
jgi:hypothetical protein